MRTIFSPGFVVLASGLIVAAAIDVRTRRIPNALTVTMAGLGIALAGAGLTGLSMGTAALGLVVGLLLMLPGHAIGATGAGDVKLMAAVGALVGPAPVVSAFLFTAVTGGALAIAVAARRGRLAETLARAGQLVAAPSEAKQAIEAPARANRFAYGPAIAIGSVLSVLVR